MAYASGRQPDSSHWSADGQLAGAPQASRFGDLPELSWLTYGSGHLHGLLASELGLEIALEPDALHRETRRRLHSADHAQPLILERGYTALGQIAQLSLSSTGGAQGEQHYQYDALGRMTFRTQQGHGQASTIAYTYDPAGRLTASQHGDHAHRYPMDAAGNRLEAQAGNPPAPNSSNRLSQLDGNRYRHDGAGNLIERETPNGERLTLGYDGANRLVRLTHTSAYGHTREGHYRYDALGRRIAKTVRQANGTTATHHYGWDGDRLVHEETDRQRTTVVYEPGTFVPMLRIDEMQHGGEPARHLSAYLTDALGTPLRLVTPQGETLWHAQPHDWAAFTHEQGTTAQPIRFQGQWHDEESGLYYNRHRYYDPQQGRYITQDPIGLNGGTNLYGYVTNPTGMVDPLGLSGMGLSNLGAAYGPAAREAHAANMPPPVPRPTGEVLTGNSYRPGVGILFPSSMSAFSRDPQYSEALAFQGASRNDITLPAASGALGLPMKAPHVTT
ncbi:RHS repeat-associated core domain-containing protein [Bisbaumannia pacifica]|uniref:RHS domain-containing protein n=1 Tax=Bisbaumannia pacifica TaxID=77098 RepID=A0ABD4L6X5_9GAMM|nr:RHS repeat-associated core domain-containing protein [Halomonas pacifica]MBH8581982.1 RHS domain-containing protein [Halomonas pacifica]